MTPYFYFSQKYTFFYPSVEVYVFLASEFIFRRTHTVSHSKMELDVSHLLNSPMEEVLDDWHDKDSYVSHHVSLLRQDFKGPLSITLRKLMAGSDCGDRASKVGRGRLIGRICRPQGVLYKLDLTEPGTEAIPGSLLILMSSSDPILCVLVEQSDTQLLLEARENPICSNQEYLIFAFSVHFEAYRLSLLALTSKKCLPLQHCILQNKIKSSRLFKEDRIDLLCLQEDHQSSERETVMSTADLYRSLMNKENIHCITNDSNQNISEDDSWSFLNMNESQTEVLRSAITNDLCLVHGPPGTGKTSVAVEIIRLVLRNRGKLHRQSDLPVLVLCATNRGLDHLLERLLSVTFRLVRLGSRSESQVLEAHNLRRLKEYTREEQLRDRSRYESQKQLSAELKGLQEELDEIPLYDSLPKDLLDKIKKVTEQLEQVQRTEDVSLLRRADIVGMTVTRAAREQKMLEMLAPTIVVVEEAAEVLEGHLVAALPTSVKHLVLLGDHLQLPPLLANTSLQRKCPDANMSLFKRIQF